MVSRLYKVEPPKTNINHKTNTMYHMHTLGASKCMHVVHSVGFAIAVGFRWFYHSSYMKGTQKVCPKLQTNQVFLCELCR